MPPALQFLVLTVAGWVNRHQDDLIDYLREENRVLREQLGSRPARLTDAQRRRLAVRGHKLGRRVLTQVAGIVTPDTILRWYRKLIAKKYDGSACRGRGRPSTRREVAGLVVRMAVDNPQWGHTRIRGALSNVGHTIARTTVKRILHDHGIDPAPERSRRLPWKTFLQAHWEGLAACDLFTVEVLTLAGLRRYLVFFVITLQSRRVAIAGIHPQPDGAWMEQLARNLTDPVDGSLRSARYLIHDRDPLYTRVFGEILESSGVQPIRLPPKSPNLNASEPLHAGPASLSRPRARFWRAAVRPADSAPAEESQSQRLCRTVRPINQRGVSDARGPARREASTLSRPRVRRALPSRAKPSGTRQPTPATTATAGPPGRGRSAAGAPRWIAQFLPSGGRMSDRPIKRTLRGTLVPDLVKNKAINNRLYFTFFDWNKGTNANQFFAIFGDAFKKRMIQEVTDNNQLQLSIKAFLEVGRDRNRLVHQNFASFVLEKTAAEIFELYERALYFVDLIPTRLRQTETVETSSPN